LSDDLTCHCFALLALATVPIIYLDNNATTQPGDGVIAAMDEILRTHWQNPSSIHRPGQAARQQVELARQSLANLIGVKARELTLTSSGTESIDLAIRGVLGAIPATSPRRTLVTTKTEHAAVRDLAEENAKLGLPVRWAPVSRDGLVDVAALASLLTPDAALVSIQWANNETGVVQPVSEIGRLCRERGVLFHCDGVQMIGKEPITQLPCDLLSFSPHKFHGPKGVGVLWARPGVKLRPTLLGSQELGRRGGTENVPGIVGAGVAAQEAAAWLADSAARGRFAGLRDDFEQRILAAIPDAVVNGQGGPGVPSRAGTTGTAVPPRLWNTTNIGFPRLEAEALLLLLSERGVCASAGAACSSGSLDPSPVLLAMGVPEAVAHGSLRFSLSKNTTREEIENAAKIVIECVGRLRQSMT
jgi:cysteine desulfurase